MLELTLQTLDDTERLGAALAEILSAPDGVRTMLLRGPLGSGKTTLTRHLVEHLAGGEQAEVSSPSFTICNHYPTKPPLLHCDLYRSGGADVPDELLEALEDGASLVLVEWAEYLPEDALPDEYLDIQLHPCHGKRLATVEPHGSAACRAVLGLQHYDGTQQ